jgi:hypothetical protein
VGGFSITAKGRRRKRDLVTYIQHQKEEGKAGVEENK